MTVARTWAVALQGVDGALVEVEADLSHQLPEFKIIGLPDKALGEAVQRVHNACANSALRLPRRRLTVNLSPAALPKHGSGFDIAIAIAALATEVPMDLTSVTSTVHIGELGLDGRLRPVRGVLPAVAAAARKGLTRVVVPHGNLEEARLVEGVDVLGAATLAEVAAWHRADVVVPVVDPVPGPAVRPAEEDALDLADVVGQNDAVEALVVAAAGGHHVMMSGPPGAGKTMLARRLTGILPDLDDDTALAAAAIRSLSGEGVDALRRTPPFEAPHHSASMVALVGGGSGAIRPGAVARASGGILFLDEAAEFSALALDALRQPMESGEIEIQRAAGKATFPARFQLVLATNPCPCGNYGVRGAECTCPPAAIRRYLGKISGPLRDRIDIDLALLRVSSTQVATGVPGTTTADARARVAAARQRTMRRLASTPWRLNAQVPGPWLRTGPFAPPTAVRRVLDGALQRGALSLRGYDRVLRLAWSIADLAGRDRLETDDVGRALFLKKGDAA